MGRILLAVAALGIIGFLAYRSVIPPPPKGDTEKSAPKQQLDNVRTSLTRSRDLEQQHADERAGRAFDEPQPTPAP